MKQARSACLALLILATGCGRPPGTDCVILYVRNSSDVVHGWEMWWPDEPAQYGSIEPGIFTTGAATFEPEWELNIGPIVADTGKPEAVERRTAADFSGEDQLVLWIDVAVDGRTINIGEGRPGWWDADVQRC